MQMIDQRTRSQLSGDLRLHLANVFLVVITASGGWSGAQALTADSEGSVLVDTVGTGVGRAEFIRLTESNTTISSSNQILDSIQSGLYESTIASTLLCRRTSSQVLGIPWMIFGDSSQPAVFASLAQNLPLPAADPSSLDAETRNTEKDIESAAPIIEVDPAVTEGVNAANSGVALITAMAHGNLSTVIDHFYCAGVIGGSVPSDVVPILSPADPHGAPASAVGLPAKK
jgi:hypothetical protein